MRQVSGGRVANKMEDRIDSRAVWMIGQLGPRRNPVRARIRTEVIIERMILLDDVDEVIDGNFVRRSYILRFQDAGK